MLRLLTVLLLATFSASPASHPSLDAVPDVDARHVATAAADPALLKAFDNWLRAYRAGKVDILSDADVEKTSIAKAAGALPKGLLGRLTAQRELQLMLDQAAAADDADVAQRVLTIASVGLDQGKYTRTMAPHVVREMGEATLAKLKSAPARELVTKVARGEGPKLGGSRDQERAILAAALRAIGAYGDAGARDALEAQLGASEPFVRLAAADALKKLTPRESIDALARALERETDDTAVVGIVGALEATMAKHQDAVDAARLAVRAAIGALGRTSWRADMSLVQMLERFRSVETIPALIDVLQRFVDNPDDVKSGKLSGLLRHRAHEVLISLTGAFHPIDAPDKWAAFWEREKAAFVLVDKPAPKQDPGTAAQGFFGIPVQGTRVVFVVDVSGSMIASVGAGTVASASDIPDTLPSRLDIAKRELIAAVEQLPEVASFQCVVFSNDVKPWNKELVLATKANKEKFKKFVEGLRAEGGTNLWGGMQEGLKMKSLVYGSRYESNVDELFILSDGLPTVGEVVQPKEILRLVAESNRFSKVRINTVYISGQTTPVDRQVIERAGMSGAELMKQLAEANGGKFVEKK